MITRLNYVVDLIADVMNRAAGILFDEAGDGRVFAIGFEQLDLGVGQFDENHLDAMLGDDLGRGDLGAERGGVNL